MAARHEIRGLEEKKDLKGGATIQGVFHLRGTWGMGKRKDRLSWKPQRKEIEKKPQSSRNLENCRRGLDPWLKNLAFLAWGQQ